MTTEATIEHPNGAAGQNGGNRTSERMGSITINIPTNKELEEKCGHLHSFEDTPWTSLFERSQDTTQPFRCHSGLYWKREILDRVTADPDSGDSARERIARNVPGEAYLSNSESGVVGRVIDKLAKAGESNGARQLASVASRRGYFNRVNCWQLANELIRLLFGESGVGCPVGDALKLVYVLLEGQMDERLMEQDLMHRLEHDRLDAEKLALDHLHKSPLRTDNPHSLLVGVAMYRHILQLLMPEHIPELPNDEFWVKGVPRLEYFFERFQAVQDEVACLHHDKVLLHDRLEAAEKNNRELQEKFRSEWQRRERLEEKVERLKSQH